MAWRSVLQTQFAVRTETFAFQRSVPTLVLHVSTFLADVADLQDVQVLCDQDLDGQDLDKLPTRTSTVHENGHGSALMNDLAGISGYRAVP